MKTKEEKRMEISESDLKAAYEKADESGRALLESLFGVENCKTVPSLKDYTTIKTYEDACYALGLYRLDEEALGKAGVPKHIIALMKLETVCKALWGGKVKVYPDAEGGQTYWYPWFALWTEGEIKAMGEKERGGLLSCTAHGGATCGFGGLNAYCRSSYSVADYGFRLCLENKEKADYFGRQFVELWAEYLAYNFTVGERLR